MNLGWSGSRSNAGAAFKQIANGHPKKAQVQVVISQGLGNQMFQYATARQLALRCDGELILAPYADGPAGSHAIYRLRHFNITGRDIAFDELDAVIRSRYWRAVRRLIAKFTPLEAPIGPIEEKTIYPFIQQSKAGGLVKTNGLLFNPVVLRRHKNVRLLGYWQNEAYFSAIAATIRREFTLKDELDPRSQACLAMIKSGISVFLHIRRGDYLEPLHADLFGICQASYYINALALLRERHGNDLRIFVFSNDFGWVKDNDIGGKDAVLVDWNEAAPQNDLMLMRACQHAVIANSSFGWWGAWLGEWPGQSVVAPKIWYKAVPEYDDIVPERWMRL